MDEIEFRFLQTGLYVCLGVLCYVIGLTQHIEGLDIIGGALFYASGIATPTTHIQENVIPKIIGGNE